MRNLTKITFICVIAMLAACNKTGNTGPGDKTLPGKWQLSESLADPGDGSGKWTAVYADDSKKYIKLNTDGSMESTAFDGYTNYAVVDSMLLRFTKPDKSAVRYRFNINNQRLTLSPDSPSRCIEACGIRFTKANN